MSRATGAALLLGLLLPAFVRAAPAVEMGALPPLDARAPLLAFGDSLTSGIGGSGENYPQRLASLIGREVVNAGVPGDTTADGAARLAAALRDSRPALLILCLGVNDFLRRLPRDEVRAHLRTMLAIAGRARVPVLLLAVPAPGIAHADPLFAEFAQAGQVRVDERAMVQVLLSPVLKADLVHPNSEGYRQIAAAVAQSLRDSGALPRP